MIQGITKNSVKPKKLKIYGTTLSHESMAFNSSENDVSATQMMEETRIMDAVQHYEQEVASCSGEDNISENIEVASSSTSCLGSEAKKRIQDDVRKRIEEKKEAEALKILVQKSQYEEVSESKKGLKFGTQLVNYQPNVVESIEVPSNVGEKDKEPGMEAKTYVGAFPNPSIDMKQSLVLHDESYLAQPSGNNKSSRRDHITEIDMTQNTGRNYDTKLLLHESDSCHLDSQARNEITESQLIYKRLKSTRQREIYMKNKKRRGFSPPLKIASEKPVDSARQKQLESKRQDVSEGGGDAIIESCKNEKPDAEEEAEDKYSSQFEETMVNLAGPETFDQSSKKGDVSSRTHQK